MTILYPKIFRLLMFSCVALWSLDVFPATPEEPIITSKRTDCLKPNGCPAYEIKIYEDGTVIYEGRHQVAVVGTRTSRINGDAINRLKSEFDRINFLRIDTSENEIDRFNTPCTSNVAYECAKLTDERKAQAGISESCAKNPTVTISVTTRYCGLGDELIYRDRSIDKRIGPNFLKNKEVMKELSRLRDVIDQISGSTVWIFRNQSESK
jgi:Domain of unknown function (DUF6438)